MTFINCSPPVIIHVYTGNQKPPKNFSMGISGGHVPLVPAFATPVSDKSLYWRCTEKQAYHARIIRRNATQDNCERNASVNIAPPSTDLYPNLV